MHSMLVRQDRNLCLGGTAYLPGPAKPPYILNKSYNLKILHDLKSPKAVFHILCYDSLCYFLPFRLGVGVKTFKSEEDLPN